MRTRRAARIRDAVGGLARRWLTVCAALAFAGWVAVTPAQALVQRGSYGGKAVIVGGTGSVVVVGSGGRSAAPSVSRAPAVWVPAVKASPQPAPQAPVPAAPAAAGRIVIVRQNLVVGPDGRPVTPAGQGGVPVPSSIPAGQAGTPGSGAGAGGSGAGAGSGNAAYGADGLTAEERQLVELVNAARRAAGLQPLAVDPRLVATAREKAADLAASGEFGHYSARLGWPWDQWRRAGIPYLTGGENLAGAGSVARAHELFMASAGHRANVLRPQYTHVGVAVASAAPFGLIVVEHFAWER